MSQSDDTTGSTRFTLDKRLGAGSAGVVYTAFDRARGETVALKTLNTRHATALYRFKREFRTLADVVHPNLVALYELVIEDDGPFFTMELVDGVDFLERVRPGGELDEERLRAALPQLAAGVKALHEADKLHCDLKPTNVLVDGEGRVVILDFGVSRDLAPLLTPASAHLGLAGTVLYMAPEQCSGTEPSPASDWYAVGVILFQALTGQLPFDGSLVEVLSAKASREAPSPFQLAPGAPQDLAELCDDLLTSVPEDRPLGGEVLLRLGVDDETEESTIDLNLARGVHAFIGRGRELALLRAAFARSRQGLATTVYVHGESGMGKTAFVEAYLRELVETADTLVLEGRCYERELVPHKALDGVVDSLSRYLTRLRPKEIAELLPEDVRYLARLFPVLLRLEAVARAAERRLPVVSDRMSLDSSASGIPAGLRRHRALRALRELLARIAARRPLVLYVDDLHWADAASASLIEELLRPPDPPPVLFVASFRSEEVEAKPFLRDLLCETGDGACREVVLGPLPEDAARELASALLWGLPRGRALIDVLVREAAGSPFFIEQLVLHVETAEARLETDVGIAEMLAARLAQLPPGADELLLTLAAAGRPLDAEVAYAAAGLEGDERPLVAALRAASLVRTSGKAGHVELYHSRLREGFLKSLESAGHERVRQIHRRLAQALLERGRDDPEALFAHLRAAGEVRRAIEQAVRAAVRAAKALAFDRAALFYRRALELGPPVDVDTTALRRGLADALAYSGRPREAAEAFLELAAGAPVVEALRYRQRAAEEYLAGGYFEEGIEAVRAVGEQVEVRVPASETRAVVALLGHRLRLFLRGLGFTRRDENEIPEEELLRADACWAMAMNLFTVQPVHATELQARHLLSTLRLGEPMRLARALNLEAMRVAARKPRAARRLARLQETAAELARSVSDPYPTALCLLYAGIADYTRGLFKSGAERCAEAEAFLEKSCPGRFNERAQAWRFGLSCRHHLGELGELRRRVPVLLAEAREQGNVQAASELRTRFNVVWLLDDDLEGARQALDEAPAVWPPGASLLVQRNDWLGRLNVELYAGEPAAALEWLRQGPDLRRSVLRGIPLLRFEVFLGRGRVGLAAAAAGLDEGFGLVEEALRRLRREKVAPAATAATLLEAGLASVHGDREEAASLLAYAHAGFEAQHMGLMATVARRRRGELLAGDKGRELCRRSEAWMKEQGVRRPERLTAMLAPGFAQP